MREPTIPERQPVDFKEHDELWVRLLAVEAALAETHNKLARSEANAGFLKGNLDLHRTKVTQL
jgi:hypothetical protein